MARNSTLQEGLPPRPLHLGMSSQTRLELTFNHERQVHLVRSEALNSDRGIYSGEQNRPTRQSTDVLEEVAALSEINYSEQSDCVATNNRVIKHPRINHHKILQCCFLFHAVGT